MVCCASLRKTSAVHKHAAKESRGALFAYSGHRQTRCRVEGKGICIRLLAIPVSILAFAIPTSITAQTAADTAPVSHNVVQKRTSHHRHHIHKQNRYHRRGCNTNRCDRIADLKFSRHMERKHARELASGWAIPSEIVRCESGFTNEPPNSAGASGYYQIKEWYDKGGRGAPYASEHTKAEQDRIAGKLYREQGTGPWTASESCWGGHV